MPQGQGSGPLETPGARCTKPAADGARTLALTGHRVILLSGTLDLLLEPPAEYLGVCARLGTEIELASQHLTGRIKGIHPYGPAKVDCLMALEYRSIIRPGVLFRLLGAKLCGSNRWPEKTGKPDENQLSRLTMI